MKGRMIHHTDGRCVPLFLLSPDPLWDFLGLVLLSKQFRSCLQNKSLTFIVVHNRQESQLYDPATNQCINSLPRPLLNLRLIQALPTDSDRMTIKFDTKLQKIDWDNNRAYGRQRVAPARREGNGKPGEEREQSYREGEKGRGAKEEEITADFDLVVGCDGSWSKVRQEMMKVERYVSPLFTMINKRHRTYRVM